MAKYHYLYALALPDISVEGLGAGVDPRFPVELVRYQRVAAVASQVGLDEFDPAKLEEGTADVEWLSKVAVDHNRIVCQVAEQYPVLPLRLGVIFESLFTLLHKLAQCQDRVTDFLHELGDRREWGVKIYLDEELAGKALGEADPADRGLSPPLDAMPAPVGIGTQYLTAKRQQVDRHQQTQALARREVRDVETHLESFTDSWCNLRLLPASLTGRREKMVSNAALLLHACRKKPFQAVCTHLCREIAPLGLILEVSGPWPPYHFCPTFDP